MSPQPTAHGAAGVAMALAAEKSRKRGGSKYGNKREPDPDGGRSFDSRLELRYAQRLKLEQRLGTILSFERQVRIPVVADGFELFVYVADFVVNLNDGRRRIVECKGSWTDYAKLKQRIFLGLWLPKHPDHDYVVEGRGATLNPRPLRRAKG